MVVEGETVQATMTATAPAAATIEAHKPDGTPVLVGTASLGPEYGETELGRRLASLRDPGELHIVDRLEVGMRQDGGVVSVDANSRNGSSYPFSLDDKLDRITEAHPWYTPEGGRTSPWGRPVLPMEMISILAHKDGPSWPVRTPSLGLFLDMEIRLIEGPIFVGADYHVTRELVGLSQSRRTESYWTRTTLTAAETGRVAGEVLLHSGVFKASYRPE
jgi:hypothetical protein